MEVTVNDIHSTDTDVSVYLFSGCTRDELEVLLVGLRMLDKNTHQKELLNADQREALHNCKGTLSAQLYNRYLKKD